MKKYILALTVLVIFGATNGIQSVMAQKAPVAKVPTALVKQLIKDDQNVRERMKDRKLSIQNITKEINSVDMIDLNGDGISEYVIYGIICGNVNCSVWIYQKTKNGYRQVPFEESVISLKPLKTKTKGYFDIQIEGHSSAIESEMRIYKFDGSRYKISECFSKKYTIITNSGKVIELKTPKVSKIKCGF